MKDRPGRPLILATFLLLSLIWGTTWAVIRIGLDGIPPFTGVALRFAIASVALLVMARLMGVRFGRSPRERALWLVNAGLSFCLSYGIVYWCEQWVPSGLASVLFATFPVFVAILAHFMLPSEPLTAGVVAGVVVAFGGVAVIFSEDFTKLGGPRVGFASAVFLASPFVSAVSNVAVKRWGAGIHPLSLTAVPMGITAGVMGAVALLTERHRPVSLDPRSVGALLYLALAGSAVTFSLYYWLLSHLPATRLALLAYTIPVVAVCIGALVMNEPFTLRTLVGSALVVAGVAIASQIGPRRVARVVTGGVVVLAVFAATSGLVAAQEVRGPLVLPTANPPAAVAALGPLEGLLMLALSQDGTRAGAAFGPAAGRKRAVILLSDAGAASPKQVELPGSVRALRFGPDGGILYGVVHRGARPDSGETFLVRIEADTLKVSRTTPLPLTAASLDIAADGQSLLVACRNEIRVLLLPELRSRQLYRVPGDNQSIASLPGGSRVLVGQADGLVLVDLSDPHGAEGMPIRDRVETPATPSSLVASPDGSEALARLTDGRTYSVPLDPLRLEEKGTSLAVAWPGVRDSYSPPPEPERTGEPVPTEEAPAAASGPAQVPQPAMEEQAEADEKEAEEATEHGTPELAREESPPAAVAPPPTPEPTEEAVVETSPAPEAPASVERTTRAPSPPPAAEERPPAQPELPKAPRVNRGTAEARGTLTGPAAGQVKAIVLFGPDHLLREAARVRPSPDGTWTAELASGRYRVVLDGGGNTVLVSEPPFAIVDVTAGMVVKVPEIRVLRALSP